MIRDQREVLESPLDQGTRERRVYAFDFSASGVVSITGTPTLLVLDGDVSDVTATVLPGVASAAGVIVTTPLLGPLVAGHVYVVYCAVNHESSQVTELYCQIRGL